MSSKPPPTTTPTPPKTVRMGGAASSSPGGGSSLGSTSETGTASTASASGKDAGIPEDDGDSINEGRGSDSSSGRRPRTGSIQSEVYYGPGILDYAGNEDPEEEGEGNPLRNESSSVIQFYPEWCHCCSCMRRTDDHAEPVHGWARSLRHMFLCPPQGLLGRAMTFVITLAALWGFFFVLFFHFHKDWWKTPAAPGGPITALFILLVLGLFVGITMKQFRLPSLLGPLILGIFLRNVPGLNIFKFFETWESRDCESALGRATYKTLEACQAAAMASSGRWIKPIRQLALSMILTRAGLELSPKQLVKLKGVVPLLAFGPCIVEAMVCAASTYLLFNVAGDYDKNGKMLTGDDLISVPMCFTAGFALAAVSPAVVVPGMLSLKRRNLGVSQGVPTLLIAASSIDDVLAISMYTISMGIALAESSGQAEWETYSSGPISVVVGIVHGLIAGMLLHFFPARGGRIKAQTRLGLLLLLNFIAMFGYELYELVSGAGSLAVLVTAFIASFGWRSQPHWKLPMKKIEQVLAVLWTICVPLLFGTIGREIDFWGFEGIRVAKILAIIFISLFCRCATAFFVAGFANLNYKERLFVAIAWIPKATVQAALAPLVVSKIQSGGAGAEHLKAHGEIVVTLAVLAILITAPSGSVLIAVFGPRLLRVATITEQIDLDEEFPNGDGPETETIRLTKKPEVTPVASGSLASMQTPGGVGGDHGEFRRSSEHDVLRGEIFGIKNPTSHTHTHTTPTKG